ncbi:MAG: MCE family protein [Actinomycetota bacterium]|nr:MCE family protein [Actinomycetota bacterium]
MSSRGTAVRRRLQGVAFLMVVASLIILSIVKYNGAFDDGVPVTLRVDRVGTQLQERSDVKVRGLIVGEVEEVSSSGDVATVHLRIQPDMIDLIPADVSARLLPKTLFGERFVSLVIPERPAAESLAAGDVIGEDRTRTAREIEAALDGLLPLLQEVEPQDLATTLGAVSQALEGRGAKLGDTLALQQRFVSELNTALPELQEDITRLADLTETYSEAAPNLVEALDDLTTTSRTVVEQRQNLSTLFDTVTRASVDLDGFLRANQENLIGLSASSRPTLESLARYAPEFPCLLDNLTGLIPKLDEALRVGTDAPGFAITLEITNSRGAYEPGEEPVYGEDRGPRCYPVAPPGVTVPQYPPDGPLQDGSFAVPNSPQEVAVLTSLLATVDGTDPADVPRWSTLLVGPLLRGAEVTLR